MTLFNESEVRGDLTGKPHFRFQDLKAYQSISGHHVKEMDYCWLDAEQLILLEMKAYADECEQAKLDRIPPDQFISSLVEKTAPKVWDSLLMFSACWLATSKGQEFRRELDEKFHIRQQIGVVIVLDVPQQFRPHFWMVKERFRSVLKGKMSLFDSRRLIVCMPSQLALTPFADYLQSAR